MKTSLRGFLFAHQKGLCYLAITEVCRARGKVMRLTGKHKNDYASTEHVIPRSKKPPGSPSLILLACCNCNNAKGDSDPTEIQIEVAMKASAAWRAFNRAQMKPKTRARHDKLMREAGIDTDPFAALADAAAAAEAFARLDIAKKVRRDANSYREEADRKRKEMLGLNRYEDSSKALAKLRKATDSALGR